MVYGIAKMLNFAHGDVIMVGCYIVFMTMSGQGWGAVPAVVLSIIVCTVLGIVIERSHTNHSERQRLWQFLSLPSVSAIS